MNLTVVEQAIKEQGIKKGWLASQIGVHPTTLRRFLKGQAELGLEQLAKLLKILNLKFETLLKKAS